MSTNIAAKLQYLYPGSIPNLDWSVGERGEGEQIERWNDALGSQPSAATLDAITDEQVTNALATRLAQAAKAAASASVDAGDTPDADMLARIVFALAEAIRKDRNDNQTAFNDLLAAINSTSWSTPAQLRTLIAPIAARPIVTKAQLATAIKNDITSTPE